MDTNLKKLVKALSKTYHVEEFMDNALSIGFDKDALPFCIAIVEDDEPETVYLSFGVDSPDPYSVADITLRSMHVTKIELAEPFYPDGDSDEMLWGTEAYYAYQASRAGENVTQAFIDAESPSKLVN